MPTSSVTNSVINTSGINVGNDGKIKVSGLSSGIDSQALIEAQIAASSVPITTIEAKITANNTKVQAYKDLKTSVVAFQNALTVLRNSLTFGSANVFTQKTATGTTAAGPLAAPGYTPSGIASLLTTTFTSKAQTASHTLTIQQLAKAQQISSDFQASTTADLSQTGTLTINGTDVTVQATDSLVDIRDAINAASGTNVTATIVSADATHNYLILTSKTTGTGSSAITLTQTALSDALGITNGSAAPKTELVEAKDAIIDVDGITGITRSSNVVSDVIDGVTLKLEKAEPDTVINIDVATDLNAVKTAIGTFASAYNDLRDFITAQKTASDRNNDGKVDDNEFGPLYNDVTLRQLADQLSFFTATQITSNDDGYQSLGQIGVTQGSDFKLAIDDSILDSKLLSNVEQISRLFGLKFTSSDSRIQAVSRTSATASGTYYLSLNGTNGLGQANEGRISLTPGSGTTDDGSLTLANNVATASDTTVANGLSMIFLNSTPGLGPISDITITVSRGLADNFFDYFDNLTKTSTGTLDTLVTEVGDQTAGYNDRVNTLNIRLDQERTNLTNKYALMETALAQLTQLQNQITQFFSSNNSSGN